MKDNRSNLAQVDPKTINFTEVKKRLEEKIRFINSYKPKGYHTSLKVNKAGQNTSYFNDEKDKKPQRAVAPAESNQVEPAKSLANQAQGAVDTTKNNQVESANSVVNARTFVPDRAQVIARDRADNLGSVETQKLLDKIDSLNHWLKKLDINLEEIELLQKSPLSLKANADIQQKLQAIINSLTNVRQFNQALKDALKLDSQAIRTLLDKYYSEQEQAYIQAKIQKANDMINAIQQVEATALFSKANPVSIDAISKQSLLKSQEKDNLERLHSVETTSLQDKIADLKSLATKLEQEKITVEKMASQSASYAEKMALMEKLSDTKLLANKVLAESSVKGSDIEYHHEVSKIKEQILSITNLIKSLQNDLQLTNATQSSNLTVESVNNSKEAIELNKLQVDKAKIEQLHNLEKANLERLHSVETTSLQDKIADLKSLATKLEQEKITVEKMASQSASYAEKMALMEKLLDTKALANKVLAEPSVKGSDIGYHHEISTIKEQILSITNLIKSLQNDLQRINATQSPNLTVESVNNSKEAIELNKLQVDKAKIEQLHNLEKDNLERLHSVEITSLQDKIADLKSLATKLEQEKITTEKMASQSVSYAEKMALMEKLSDTKLLANKVLAEPSVKGSDIEYHHEISTIKEQILSITNFIKSLQNDLQIANATQSSSVAIESANSANSADKAITLNKLQVDKAKMEQVHNLEKAKMEQLHQLETTSLQADKVRIEQVHQLEQNNLVEKVNELKKQVNKLEIAQQTSHSTTNNVVPTAYNTLNGSEQSLGYTLMQNLINKFSNHSNNSDNLMKELIQYKLVSSLMAEDNYKNAHTSSMASCVYTHKADKVEDKSILQNIFFELGALNKAVKGLHEHSFSEYQHMKVQAEKNHTNLSRNLQDVVNNALINRERQNNNNNSIATQNEKLAKVLDLVNIILVKQENCLQSSSNIEKYTLTKDIANNTTTNILSSLKEQQVNLAENIQSLKQNINNQDNATLMIDIKNLLEEVNHRNIVFNKLIEKTKYTDGSDIEYIQESLAYLMNHMRDMQNTILNTLDKSDNQAMRRYISLAENAKYIQSSQQDSLEHINKLKNTLSNQVKGNSPENITAITQMLQHLQVAQEEAAHNVNKIIQSNFENNSVFSESALSDLKLYMQDSKKAYSTLQEQLEKLLLHNQQTNQSVEDGSSISSDIVHQVKALDTKLIELKTYYNDSLSSKIQHVHTDLQALQSSSNNEIVVHKLDIINNDIAEFKNITTNMITNIADNKENTTNIISRNNEIMATLNNLNQMLSSIMSSMSDKDGIINAIRESFKDDLTHIVKTFTENQGIMNQRVVNVVDVVNKLNQYSKNLDKQLEKIANTIQFSGVDLGNLESKLNSLTTQDSVLNQEVNKVLDTVNHLKLDTLKMLENTGIALQNKNLLNDKLESMHTKITDLNKVIAKVHTDGASINNALKELLINTDMITSNNNEVKQDLTVVRNKLQSFNVAESMANLQSKLVHLVNSQKDLLKSNQQELEAEKSKDEIKSPLLKADKLEFQDIALAIFHKLSQLEKKYKTTNKMFKNLNEEILTNLSNSPHYARFAEELLNFSQLHEEAIASLNSNVALVEDKIKNLSLLGQLKNKDSESVSALYREIENLEAIQDKFFIKYHNHTNQVIAYIKNLKGNLFNTKLSILEDKIQEVMLKIENPLKSKSVRASNVFHKKSIDVKQSLHDLNREISDKIKKEKS